MARSRPRVLIADDQPTLLNLFATWLEGEGIDLVRTTCGAEVLSYCEGGVVDVAVMDRRLPRVSGDEVLDRFQEQESSQRVAFVTASVPDVHIVDLHVGAYLTKSVAREEYVDL